MKKGKSGSTAMAAADPNCESKSETGRTLVMRFVPFAFRRFDRCPCRHGSAGSNPTFYGSRGQGPKKRHRPLPPEALLRGTMAHNGRPLIGTRVEDSLKSHRWLCNPRGLVRGHTARCPRLDTISFRHLSTRWPPAGKGPRKQHRPLCTPHQGAPGPGRGGYVTALPSSRS